MFARINRNSEKSSYVCKLYLNILDEKSSIHYLIREIFFHSV